MPNNKKGHKKNKETRDPYSAEERLQALKKDDFAATLKHLKISAEIEGNDELMRYVETQQLVSKLADLSTAGDCFKRTIGAHQGESDCYGNGDQSPLSGYNAQFLRHKWKSAVHSSLYPIGCGGDYNPLAFRMSDWSRYCYKGELEGVKREVERNPKIIDYRESVLRMCGLLHVVAGSRATSSSYPENGRFEPTETADHLACLRYLIERGADVGCRDFAGYTPLHHCLTSVGNDLSFRLAEHLLSVGADPNAVNRFGCSPLFECVMSSNVKFIEFLLDNGARVDMHDNDGCFLGSMSRIYPVIDRLFSESLAREGRAKRMDAKASGRHRACRRCGVARDCKRCAGCYVVWYCGGGCQKADWKSHKPECKTTQGQYRRVTFDRTISRGTPIVNHRGQRHNRVDKDAPVTKKHCIVKIQIPLNTMNNLELPLARTEGPNHLLVYDKERNVSGFIPESDPNYLDIVNAVKDKGVGKVKGYFYAIVEGENDIRVNIANIQPPEDF